MLLLFVSGITILALQTSHVQNRIAEELETRFNSEFKGELHIGELKGTLPLSLVLENVSLSLPADSSGPVMEVPKVYLRMDLSRSLFERFTLSHIELLEPDIKMQLREQGRYGLQEIFAREQSRRDTAATARFDPRRLPELNILAISIESGNIDFKEFPAAWSSGQPAMQLPDSLRIENFDMFSDVQFSGQQQFLNISRLRADVPALDMQQFTLSGQFYADERFIELNRFELKAGTSRLAGSISLEGSEYAGNTLREQLGDKSIRLRISESVLLPDEFRDIFPDAPQIGEAFRLDTALRYREGAAVLERFEAGYGQSSIIMNGEVERLFELEDYRLEVETARFFQDDVRRLSPEAGRLSFAGMGLLNLEARLTGSRDSLQAQMRLRPPEGNISIEAEAKLSAPFTYALTADVEALALSEFPATALRSGNQLNSRLELSGRGVDLAEARAELRLAIYESRIGSLNLEQLQLTANLDDGFLEPRLQILSGEGSAEMEGWIDLLATEPRINLDGRTRSLDLSRLIDAAETPESRLNTNFSLVASGTSLDRYAGEFYINAYDSDYQQAYIEEQEFMLSLNDADEQERRLSIGGTLLEADITSSMKPSRLLDAAGFWAAEMARTAEDVSYYELHEAPPPAVEDLMQEEQDINVRARIDDLTLLSKLFEGVPAISTIANFDASITMKADELSVETDLLADFLTTEGISADSLIFRNRASFTPGRRVDFFAGNAELHFATLEAGGVEFNQANMQLDAYDEAIVLQRLRVLTGEDVELGAMASAVFSRQEVDIRIMDFFIGDDEYVWQNIAQTPITLDEQGRIHVDRLEFGNLQERFIIDGTFSENPEDSVSYLMSGLQLERISGLIDGKVNFSGMLDGTFSTRSLRSDPSFSGDLSVQELRLNNNLAGDLQFTSRFDPDARQFDTRLQLSTDQEEYEEYLDRPDTGGQDIIIEGIVRTLGSIEAAEEEGTPPPLVDLDIEVGNVDLWFLPLILENIFTDAGGQGSGNGHFEVLADGSIRYDSEFDVRDGRLRPVFLDAPLRVSGNLRIDSENGATFNDMPVRDNNDGTGTLSGQVDFGIGQGETFFDLQLAMQNLRFMDNSDGPDMPFFGTGIGSGTVQLTGSSNAPYISTPSPVLMSSESSMNIPLDTEETVEGSNRFIQFVESFDQSYDELYYGDAGNGGNGNGSQEEEVDLTFMEKFEFDLRFESDEAMSVRLIFDEVTSEVLSARGTGRIRLSLQDEVFQVFGQFDVEGGDYLFVGGDLFARRFSIREGGNITWEGDPVNAAIDVAAAYRARPDINQLRGTASADATPVRVPVDLILNISGTLESVENEFYFEFPSGADVTQTATLAATLNSEDTKLLQATSILLTGNFVPVDTGLNDLFTSQIGAQGLGTLLSSQISSLLNSNISNLDINLNMTGFDEADLGIALYLFDDRLTLRREGVVTGPNSNIGDFDVTYRINQYLSLEAFHRRESLLPSAVSVGQAQTDESYGMGVEARVQFNTWSELGHRLSRPFRPLFGSNAKKEEEEPDGQESEVAEESRPSP